MTDQTIQLHFASTLGMIAEYIRIWLVRFWYQNELLCIDILTTIYPVFQILFAGLPFLLGLATDIPFEVSIYRFAFGAAILASLELAVNKQLCTLEERAGFLELEKAGIEL